jgi:sigma-B regulation protein RsbU (phosphoserine phosphatase)
MIAKSALRGVLTVYNKKGQAQFTEEDQRLLAIIAAQSAQVVETARLYEMERSLIHMKEEVRLAARIQTDLLPRTSPAPAGYDIAGKSVPAQMVGGDYFDFMQMPGGRYGVTLGDVSGKGLPAALLMANLQATLRGQTLFGGSVHECIQRSNKLLAESTSPEKFVTLFYSVLDPGAKTLTYCNAGHDAPMLLRAGGASERLATGGVVLSILDDFPYQEETVPFGPGDLMVVYSDGISEAMNPAEEQFGEARIADVVGRERNRSATEIIESIVAAVRAHAGSAPQMDDMTLVVIKGS